MSSNPTNSHRSGEDSVRRMQVEYIPDRNIGGYTARVPQVPVFGEGESKEEAFSHLESALRLFIVHEGRSKLEELLNQKTPFEWEKDDRVEVVEKDVDLTPRQ